MATVDIISLPGAFAVQKPLPLLSLHCLFLAACMEQSWQMMLLKFVGVVILMVVVLLLPPSRVYMFLLLGCFCFILLFASSLMIFDRYVLPLAFCKKKK